jgi:murein L,D-transpeptidase YcbB/YkuD
MRDVSIRGLRSTVAGLALMLAAGTAFAAPGDQPLDITNKKGEPAGTINPSTPPTVQPIAPVAPVPDTAAPLAPIATPPVATPPADTAAPLAPVVPFSMEPTDPVAPAVADTAFAGAIGALLAGDTLSASGDRLEVLAAFYAARDNRPVWIENGGFGARGEAVLARLARASEDGLSPALLALPSIAVTGDAAARAEADVRLSLAVLAFADAASSGQVEPSSISRNITIEPEGVDPAAALTEAAGAADPIAVLNGFNPPHEGFRLLRERLAEVRATVEPVEQLVPIAEGATLRAGDRDPRVALIRERLGLPAPALDADLYDPTLEVAVEAFQEASGLVGDGIIGPRTIAVFNGADRDEEGSILASMEMWRWLPRDLGSEYVLVNIPEYMVRVVRDGVVTHETRVVVGTAANQTPVFSDKMEYLVVNPSWNVPNSIATNEMLPEILADPAGYFQRTGYEVTYEGQVIDPAMVAWTPETIAMVRIRQPPGEANALGHIKFMFPNEHAVYLHDTPSRSLFQRDYRAYSHGCVRVDDPIAFAGAVLADEPYWNAERVQALVGGRETQVQLADGPRVHLAYFTAWVDAAGVLQLRDDIYGHAGRIKEALGLQT